MIYYIWSWIKQVFRREELKKNRKIRIFGTNNKGGKGGNTDCENLWKS